MEVRERQAFLCQLGAKHAEATHQWHDLKVCISGTKVQGYLDGKLYLEHTLAQPVSGRIGLWSKADSHIYFSDYTVTTSN